MPDPCYDLTPYVGLAGAPLVVALTQLTKLVLPRMRSRWFPLLAVGWGIALNLAIAVEDGAELWFGALLGIAAGLMAVGFYDTLRRAIGPSQLPPGNGRA